MWKLFPVAGTTLAVILLARASSASAPAVVHPPPTCVNPTATYKAYLVVQHLNGAVLEKCVGFNAATLSADSLMKRSGVGYQTRHLTTGTAVCSIDGEPIQVTECFPRGGPWWSLWLLSGGGGWAKADTAYNDVALKDGEALGWRYAESESPPPLPMRQ